MLAENAKRIPELEHTPGNKGTELSKTPVELKGGDWMLKVVPWIGGRIIAMEHHPSGMISTLCKQSFEAFNHNVQSLEDVFYLFGLDILVRV